MNRKLFLVSATVIGAVFSISTSQPAGASPEVGSGPAWSVSTATTGCPASMRLLTPNRSADWFAAHPDDLLATKGSASLDPRLRAALSQVAAHHIHYLTTVTCKPGHQRGPRTPVKEGSTSGNWSGYQSASRGDFLGAFMYWNVPSVSTAANTSAYSSIWPGIGRGNSAADSLVQDGTEQDVSCLLGICTHDYYPWYEVYPAESQEEITNLSVSPNDLIESFIEWEPTQGAAYFEVDNLTTNTGVYGYQYTATNFTNTGSTAEWIVERTEVNGQLPPLANFGTVSITAAIAAEGQSWEDPNLTYPSAQDVSSSAITMTSCNGSLTLARPSALDSFGSDFTDTFVQRGSSQTC